MGTCDNLQICRFYFITQIHKVIYFNLKLVELQFYVIPSIMFLN